MFLIIKYEQNNNGMPNHHIKELKKYYEQLRGRPKAEVLLSAKTESRPKATLTHSAETVCATESESKAELSAENRNRKSIVSGPKPIASLMPACQGSQVTVPGCRRRQRSQLPRLS